MGIRVVTYIRLVHKNQLYFVMYPSRFVKWTETHLRLVSKMPDDIFIWTLLLLLRNSRCGSVGPMHSQHSFILRMFSFVAQCRVVCYARWAWPVSCINAVNCWLFLSCFCLLLLLLQKEVDGCISHRGPKGLVVVSRSPCCIVVLSIDINVAYLTAVAGKRTCHWRHFWGLGRYEW